MAIFFKPKAKLVIMSHLSDAQEGIDGLMDTSSVRLCNKDINFAKFLILKYYDNLDVEIDADEEFKEFELKFPKF